GFVANEGQADPQVRFLSQGPGSTLFLTATGAVLALRQPADSGHLSVTELGLQFAGAAGTANPVALDPLPGSTSYLIGNDPNRWFSNVPSYGRVEYPDIYPGVTLDYHNSASGRLEYDFTVAPGADPAQIRLAFQGADRPTLDAAGNLVLHTAV